jgi:hypothetical protein
MKVGVQMNDGTFRAYNVDLQPSEGYDKIIKIIMKEVIGAKRAVVMVPKKAVFSFNISDKVTA